MPAAAPCGRAATLEDSKFHSFCDHLRFVINIAVLFLAASAIVGVLAHATKKGPPVRSVSLCAAAFFIFLGVTNVIGSAQEWNARGNFDDLHEMRLSAQWLQRFGHGQRDSAISYVLADVACVLAWCNSWLLSISLVNTCGEPHSPLSKILTMSFLGGSVLSLLDFILEAAMATLLERMSWHGECMDADRPANQAMQLLFVFGSGQALWFDAMRKLLLTTGVLAAALLVHRMPTTAAHRLPQRWVRFSFCVAALATVATIFAIMRAWESYDTTLPGIALEIPLVACALPAWLVWLGTLLAHRQIQGDPSAPLVAPRVSLELGADDRCAHLNPA